MLLIVTIVLIITMAIFIAITIVINIIITIVITIITINLRLHWSFNASKENGGWETFTDHCSFPVQDSHDHHL